MGRFTNEALGEIELSVITDEAGLEADRGGFQITMRPLVDDPAADDKRSQRSAPAQPWSMSPIIL
jgi:hypothetical protein